MDSRTVRRVGWIFFSLMWIPFLGIFVGMIGFPEGSYSWQQLPVITRYSLIGTAIFFGLSMLTLMGGQLFSAVSNRQVLNQGRRGEAVIVDMWDTGTTINQNPVVGFRLKVEPISGPPFEAETERLIPRLIVPQIQVGTRVPVRYDLKSKKVAIELDRR